MKIIGIYNSYFTGSLLWDLSAGRLHNTWSTSLRRMFRLDRKTHQYLIEPISRVEHIKLSLMKRQSSLRNLVRREKGAYVMCTTVMCTIVGKNARMIQRNCNIYGRNVRILKKDRFILFRLEKNGGAVSYMIF